MSGLSDTEQEMLEKAKQASKNSRAHISNFRVGAAILAGSGTIYTGCNIEFDNFSNTIHAEESAISAFIGAGETEMSVIAVFTYRDKPVFPCGMCLQSLYELGGSDLKVIAGNEKGFEVKTLKGLLPTGFHL